MMKRLMSVMMLSVVLAACAPESSTGKAYLEVAGGGFMFNYRNAEADYGFIAKVLRPLPEGGVVEAAFENPAGGQALIVTQPVRAGLQQYYFRSPPVQGVQAGKDYQVEIRVRSALDGEVLAQYSKAFHADLDQELLPEQAPVVGPGYMVNPATQAQANPQ